MLYTSSYQLDTSDTEWQVAHLYEHILINMFYDELERKNLPSNMIMWLDGETFENRMFIDAGFYNKAQSDVFIDYMKNIPEFTPHDVEYSLATISAESKVVIAITNKKLLYDELNRLRRRTWNTTLDAANIPDGTILREQPKSKDFRSVTIITKADNLTHDEQKVFLRLRILLLDLCTVALLPIKGLYARGHSDVVLQDNAMAYMTQLTISKGTSLRDIRGRLASITDSGLPDVAEVTQIHFKVFAVEPVWQNAPTDYYRWTNIATTNQEIADLATPERINSILTKVSFEVRQSIPEDSDHIN